VDKCPTNALFEPYKLDPRKCITYILNQEKIPPEFLEKIGNRILGCDICQDVCPKNKNLAPKSDAESVLPEKIGVSPSLLVLLSMNEETFRSEVLGGIGEKFSQSSSGFIEEMVPNTFQKAGGKIMVYMRNVLLALGNIGDPVAVPYLAKALMFPQPLIRQQAAWSLGKIRTSQSKEALEKALSSELDEDVKAEIGSAIERIGEA
jgi:epoxyqueuosine reductase